MASSVTLKDIALETNLSVAAVSKALNGYRHVSLDTRERVLAAAKRMNYKPRRRNEQGNRESDAPSRPMVVGLLIVGLQPSSAYRQRWLHAMSRAAEGRGVRLQLNSIDEEQLLAGQPLKEMVRDLDALLLSGPLNGQAIDAVDRVGIPWVMIGHVQGRHGTEIGHGHVVASDEVAMGEIATNALIRAGHRRIAVFCGNHPPDTWNDRWISGYRVALRHHQIAADPALVCVLPQRFVSPQPTEERRVESHAVRKMLAIQDPPTAFVVPNARAAARLIDRFAELGYSISRDQLVIGADESECIEYGVADYPQVVTDVQATADSAVAMLDVRFARALPRHVTMMVPFNTIGLADISPLTEPPAWCRAPLDDMPLRARRKAHI